MKINKYTPRLEDLSQAISHCMAENSRKELEERIMKSENNKKFEQEYSGTFDLPIRERKTRTVVAEVELNEFYGTPEEYRNQEQSKQLKIELANLLVEELLKTNLIEFEKVDSHDYGPNKYRAKLDVGDYGNFTFAPDQNVQVKTETVEKVVYRDRLTQKQLDFIWKLLPPKITGIDPSKNPLRHLQIGIEQKKEHKKLGRKIAKALKQTTKTYKL